METEKQAEIPATVNQEGRLNKKVGTIEPVKLEAKPVTVTRVTIQVSKKKSGEVVGEIVHMDCKHPDQEETIDLSKTKFLKGDNLKDSGLWFKEDTAGQIMKVSALAAVMKFYGADDLKSMVGKEIQTITNSEGYLVIKSF